ncbi:GH3 auxin-responsive promoter family protein [soil metagenome]
MQLGNLDILAGQALRRVTHIRRFYKGLKEPRETQLDKLKGIIETNKNTAFGRDHHFDRINSYEDFKNHVPQSRYEDLEPYIDKLRHGETNQLTAEDPFMFATTSGTTATPKFIPITEAHLRDYTHAFQVHNYHLVVDFPKGAAGKFLIISSNDEEGRTPAGLPYGAVSGVLNRRQPDIIRRHFALPYELCKVKNVDAKYYLLLRAAVAQDVTALLGCNPSSFILLAEQMKLRSAELIEDIAKGTLNSLVDQIEPVNANVRQAFDRYLRPDLARAKELTALLDKHGKLLPKHVWPRINILSLWKGGPMSFYLEKLPDLFGPVPQRDFGYMASEGRGTVPIANNGSAGPLAVTSHFFEFVAEDQIDSANPIFLLADQLMVGGRYYIYFTTNAGLYRYNINDLMEVDSIIAATPVLKFVRKGGGVSSVTGEKLTEEQVLTALEQAVNQLGLLELKHFTAEVALEMPPYYLCYAETERELPQSVIDSFLLAFDQSLQAQNPEYADKRATRRLGEPRLKYLPAGTYTRLRQQRVHQGAPEAQVKIPLLSAQGNFSHSLETLVNL